MAQARTELRGAQQLPQYVILRNDAGEDIGFVTLTYDNIGVFTIDSTVRIALQQKVARNFAASEGISPRRAASAEAPKRSKH